MTRWIWLSMTLVCVAMTFGNRPAVKAESSDVAVLQTRADAIDRHLVSTDAIADKLWSQVNEQGRSLAEMQGENRVAFAILGLFTGGNLVIQFKGKRKES